MTKAQVLNIIDEVMNNREIDSIRNAILAIRDKVIDLPDSENAVTLTLRGDNPLQETIPWSEGCKYVRIDTFEKIDTGIYGSIEYYE